MINFKKISITFSPNVSDEVKTDIGEILGVSSKASYDIYLGVLSLIGSNKNLNQALGPFFVCVRPHPLFSSLIQVHEGVLVNKSYYSITLHIEL